MSEPPTLDYRTDEQLFAAINRGDLSAFETFYARHHDFVYRLAWRFVAHEADALDVMQAVFQHLLLKAPALVLTARTTTYLYAIVRSVAISRIRERSRASPLDQTVEDGLCAPPPAVSADLGDLAIVLRTLPGPQREVVLMRFVDDLSLEDIAAALDIPLGTVKSRLHHALATLRGDDRTRQYFET